MCGDCTDKAVVAMAMGGDRADMVWTDPPYGVNYSGGRATPTSVRTPLVGDNDASLYLAFLKSTMAFIADHAALYIWHSSAHGLEVYEAIQSTGYEICNEIVWNKNHAQFGAIGAQYKAKHEPVLYCFRKGHTPQWFGPTNEVTVWDEDRANVNEFHPTQKPVALAERAMNNSSKPGDIVFDPFLGGGAALVAAERLGRVGRGIEIAPGYVAVSIKRWEDLTGLKAVCASGQ